MREARRLRPMSRLDYEIYHTLMNGYVELQKPILELSEKHRLESDVRSFYHFLKVEASMTRRGR